MFVRRRLNPQPRKRALPMNSAFTLPAPAEADRVVSLADWYQTEQLNFDRRMIGYKYQTFKPWLRGPSGLELGPADGTMTRHLVHDFQTLTVVDGSSELLDAIPDAANLVKVHALFEDFNPAAAF